MSIDLRRGPPMTPTEDVAPADGVTAGKWTFDLKGAAVDVFPCIVNNTTGKTIYGKINTTTAASVTDFDFVIGDDDHLDVSFGVVGINQLTIWIPTDGVEAGLQIRGWHPGLE